MANIYEKIANIMQNVQYLAKDDNVEYKNTKYRAMSEEKVTSIMRKQMLEQGLVVFPEKMTASRENNITHIDVTYKMVNIENPDEYIYIASAGDGADTQDKGSGKAMTYAFKYMWLRTFAIPTGDDPDKICNEEIEDRLKAKSEQDAAIECANLRSKILKYANKHYTAAQIGEIPKKYGKKNINEMSAEDCADFISLLNEKGNNINE